MKGAYFNGHSKIKINDLNPYSASENEVIIEIKALDQLSGTEESQIINYLKASKLKVGLLINFGSKSLEYKRFVYNY